MCLNVIGILSIKLYNKVRLYEFLFNFHTKTVSVANVYSKVIIRNISSYCLNPIFSDLWNFLSNYFAVLT